jgi:hypothetical protein
MGMQRHVAAPPVASAGHGVMAEPAQEQPARLLPLAGSLGLERTYIRCYGDSGTPGTLLGLLSL